MTETLEHLRGHVLVAAIVAGGLQAGTYYTWASGVMPGLARVDDRTFVETMQQANAAIVNPVFLASFFGAPALAAAAAVAWDGPARPWLVAGAGLAVVTLVVTVARNVPLNDALAVVSLDRADLGAARAAFEGPWRRSNVVRTVASAASVACLAWAATRQ